MEGKQLRFKEYQKEKKKSLLHPHHSHEKKKDTHTQMVFPDISLRLTRRWVLTLSEA